MSALDDVHGAMRGALWRWRAWRALRSARRLNRAVMNGRAAHRVLVVCYGNIYRSAYAAALLRARLGPPFEVRSAGFHAKSGRSAPERLQVMAGRAGLDLAAHRSTVAVAADADWADLILLMDRPNWVRLRRLGAPVEKLVWLGGCAPGAVEIADPYRLDDAALAAILAQLEACCEAFAAALESGATGALIRR